MNNETKKVERWVKKCQTNCRYIRWEKMECRSITPYCRHEQRNGERCVYKHCPLNSQS